MQVRFALRVCSLPELTAYFATGANTGITVPGKTGWTQGKTKKTVVVDVTTEACGYKKAPAYFTTMRGFTNHWRVQGSHIVYFPKAKSFRTYIVYDNPITPKMAEGYKWQISWIGDTSIKSGTSDSDWKLDSSGNGLYIDVNTNSSGFSFPPSYVTSATTNYMHWNVNGGGSLYSPTSGNFRLYLNHAVKVTVAKFYKWKVNYIGYDGPGIHAYLLPNMQFHANFIILVYFVYCISNPLVFG